MSYTSIIEKNCKKKINKLCKKNYFLEKVLKKKISEIIQNPHHYKSLRNELFGERRIHILNSFVLKFKIDEENKKIIFIFFGHHDEAY